MALSLFKKSWKPTPERPALENLRLHLARIAGITDRRNALGERTTAIRRDIQHADRIAADLDAAREAIVAAEADAAYNQQPAPELRAERRRVTELETELKAASEQARRGSAILGRLQSDYESLGAERDALKPTTDRLLWEAAVEEGVTLRAEYETAMATMRQAAHKVFAAFTAADVISKSRSYGEFYGSGLYEQMQLPIPQHPAYTSPSITAEAAQAIWLADIAAVSEEADNLIQRLLNGDA